MVDAHFMAGFLCVGLAADLDPLFGLGEYLAGVGAERPDRARPRARVSSFCGLSR
jgi:hypothetical protein